MSDDYDDDEQVEFEDNRTRTVPRDVWKRMEKQAKESQALAEANAKLERRLAFSDAGIVTSDPKLAYFVKGYDGPLTPEAIKQAAVEAGFLTAAAPSEDVPAEELAAYERASQVAAGSGSAQTEDVMSGARAVAEATRKAGGDPAIAIAEYLKSRGVTSVRMPGA
jgi:hypothetical protein